ncbi:efflux RND transporter periplasmic adaptor subunit [Sphingosinicella rhizophila]|uniref:Efflux RND transporter periplasmic adaptor subunit n=1 Tax=Sphingosinicella rhizophila TaxID=3050082 RepID=A0ABU3Q6S6_9SPHN|nr:efflux RND transporter periplasmic adaptor subunit [Sphingosinicella sp. GR2756]MDT9599012.1 efflux RND transporter periplasmic adaptor subunit [Sphingosinicella sp. GR2756]
MTRNIWILVFAASLLASCGRDKAAEPQARLRTPTGERLTLAAVAIPERKSVAAEITTRDQAEALARISGRLVRLSVREGDMVTRGQAIGLVVDERIGPETRALEAQIAAAAAEAERAGAELRRVEYLHRRGFYALARLEQAQAGERSARAQLAAARESRSASVAFSGQGEILAPASGRVLRADIPPGSSVVPGMSVATVTAGPPLLRLHVPQSLADRIGAGTAVTVDEDGFETRAGRIVQVYPATAAGQVVADADLSGLAADLVGRRVSVVLDVGSRRGILVPRRFVLTRYGIDYVDLVGREGAVARIPVQTAPAPDPTQVELLTGVSPGDILQNPGNRG